MGSHTLFNGQRETEKEREKERCLELLFTFLKGMMGVLAPFGYLVNIIITHAD
jgi:hypothetical protein